MSIKEKSISKEDSFDILTGDTGNFLVLYNDDYHTFDYVIKSLIDVCGMPEEQAVQCTYLVHYKGKCDIKKGQQEELKIYKTKLTELGLKAKIE